jgi:hypothetical protein
MWSKTYSEKFSGIDPEAVWKAWTDINRWNAWQSDIDYAKLSGSFEVGNHFVLRPKGGPEVKIEIIEAVTNQCFTDLTRFPGAKMYGKHEFIRHADWLELKTTMSIEWPFSFIWRKIVAEGIVKGLEQQTAELVAYVKTTA